MSTALALFHQLCEIADGLEYVRDQAVPATETWMYLTELLLQLDVAIDMLVCSRGLGGEDDG